MEQSLAGSERIGDAVNLKLTIDLSNQSLRNVPDEVVEIIRRDVERYDCIHINALWDTRTMLIGLFYGRQTEVVT